VYLSDKEKPSFPTKYKDAPVHAHKRAIFPVFCGISGSYKTTLSLDMIISFQKDT
jgi:hypothetical protein